MAIIEQEPLISDETQSVALVLFNAPESFELTRRRRELRDARALLAAREQFLSDLRIQLVSFEGRYIRQVGTLYRKLDEWEQKIAALHGAESTQAPWEEDLEADAVNLDVGVSLLKDAFHSLIKLIYPDFAENADDERRRTRLMAQANDAYARHDLPALKRMFNGYDPCIQLHSRQAVSSEITRILASIFQVTQDIEAVNLQVEELQHSESAKLQQRALEAARLGRDLLAERAARVNGSIGLAMRQYELDLSRKSNPPKGLSVEVLVTAEKASV